MDLSKNIFFFLTSNNPKHSHTQPTKKSRAWITNSSLWKLNQNSLFLHNKNLIYAKMVKLSNEIVQKIWGSVPNFNGTKFKVGLSPDQWIPLPLLFPCLSLILIKDLVLMRLKCLYTVLNYLYLFRFELMQYNVFKVNRILFYCWMLFM